MSSCYSCAHEAGWTVRSSERIAAQGRGPGRVAHPPKERVTGEPASGARSEFADYHVTETDERQTQSRVYQISHTLLVPHFVA